MILYKNIMPYFRKLIHDLYGNQMRKNFTIASFGQPVLNTLGES